MSIWGRKSAEAKRAGLPHGYADVMGSPVGEDVSAETFESLPASIQNIVVEARSSAAVRQERQAPPPRIVEAIAAGSADTWNGKAYADLTVMERHQLACADRALFDRMRAPAKAEAPAAPTYNGKTWGEMNNEQLHALAVADRPLFDRMYAARNVRR